MSNIYIPHRWVLIDTTTCVKVFATWFGGYIEAESWKLSSGTTKIIEEVDAYILEQYSGSVYKLHKESEGTTLWSSGVLNSMMSDEAKALGVCLVDIEKAKNLC